MLLPLKVKINFTFAYSTKSIGISILNCFT